MYHNGTIELTGNIVMNGDGSAELQNIIPQRVDTATESQLTASLAQVHVGRIVFNTSSNTLKTWNGTSFDAVGGELAAVEARFVSLTTSIGPIVGTNGMFDATQLSQLMVIDTTNVLSIFDLFKSVDTKLGELSQPLSVSELADIEVSTPQHNQILQFNSISSKWENSDVTLSDVTDITASATSLNFCQGLTENVQDHIDSCEIEFTALNATVSSHTSQLARLNQVITTFEDQTTVDFEHEKNKQYVDVLVVDSSYTKVEPASIVYVSANMVKVVLPTEMSGTIIVS